MAVYTQLGTDVLAAIIAEYDVGTLLSAKGIAEGVSNSNWLIETTGKGDAGPTRYFLTMYEYRLDIGDLPYFLGLLDHLADRKCPVPRTIHDRGGSAYRMHDGKALALIEFLPGVTIDQPTPAQALAVGTALAQMHLEACDFAPRRANTLALADWHALARDCGREGLDDISTGLAARIEAELDFLDRSWPEQLPRSVIHADLFPDNVLMLDDRVTGMIDFYFACNDITAYDLAVTHAAWCFSSDGAKFDPAISAALLAGYRAVRPLSAGETDALPILARGAAMRFLMTRAYDWMHTPADALVTRKDPMAFARRMQFYADPANADLFGPA